MSMHELAAPLYEASQATQRLTEQMSDAGDLLGDFEGAPFAADSGFQVYHCRPAQAVHSTS